MLISRRFKRRLLSLRLRRLLFKINLSPLSQRLLRSNNLFLLPPRTLRPNRLLLLRLLPLPPPKTIRRSLRSSRRTRLLMKRLLRSRPRRRRSRPRSRKLRKKRKPLTRILLMISLILRKPRNPRSHLPTMLNSPLARLSTTDSQRSREDNYSHTLKRMRMVQRSVRLPN